MLTSNSVFRLPLSEARIDTGYKRAPNKFKITSCLAQKRPGSNSDFFYPGDRLSYFVEITKTKAVFVHMEEQQQSKSGYTQTQRCPLGLVSGPFIDHDNHLGFGRGELVFITINDCYYCPNPSKNPLCQQYKAISSRNPQQVVSKLSVIEPKIFFESMHKLQLSSFSFFLVVDHSLSSGRQIHLYEVQDPRASALKGYHATTGQDAFTFSYEMEQRHGILDQLSRKCKLKETPHAITKAISTKTSFETIMQSHDKLVCQFSDDHSQIIRQIQEKFDMDSHIIFKPADDAEGNGMLICKVDDLDEAILKMFCDMRCTRLEQIKSEISSEMFTPTDDFIVEAFFETREFIEYKEIPIAVRSIVEVSQAGIEMRGCYKKHGLRTKTMNINGKTVRVSDNHDDAIYYGVVSEAEVEIYRAYLELKVARFLSNLSGKGTFIFPNQHLFLNQEMNKPLFKVKGN